MGDVGILGGGTGAEKKVATAGWRGRKSVQARTRRWLPQGPGEGGDGCEEEEKAVSAESWRRRLRLRENEKTAAPGPRRIGGVEEKVEVAG